MGVSTGDCRDQAVMFLMQSGTIFSNFLDSRLSMENVLGAVGHSGSPGNDRESFWHQAMMQSFREDGFMTDGAISSLQGTSSLLAQARQDVAHSGELVKLVMSGVGQVDSWLIENRILPVLQRANAKILHLEMATCSGETKSATLIPLSDGSAFVRSTVGQWFALDQPEATAAIEHVGFRYAPQGRWEDGFRMLMEVPGQPPVPIGPFEAAAIWKETTGRKVSGFEDGLLDEIEAVGLKLIDMFFDTQGQLGL